MSVNKIVVGKAYKINVDKLFDMCNGSDAVWGLQRKTFQLIFNGSSKIIKILLPRFGSVHWDNTNVITRLDVKTNFILQFDNLTNFCYEKELFDVLYNDMNLIQEEFEI